MSRKHPFVASRAGPDRIWPAPAPRHHGSPGSAAAAPCAGGPWRRRRMRRLVQRGAGRWQRSRFSRSRKPTENPGRLAGPCQLADTWKFLSIRGACPAAKPWVKRRHSSQGRRVPLALDEFRARPVLDGHATRPCEQLFCPCRASGKNYLRTHQCSPGKLALLQRSYMSLRRGCDAVTDSALHGHSGAARRRQLQQQGLARVSRP